MADEVRLHLVLLDEVAFAIEVDAPVDVLGIVAPDVLAVAGELDGEARQRRLVAPARLPSTSPRGSMRRLAMRLSTSGSR